MPSNWYWANSAGNQEVMQELASQCASDTPEILLNLARLAQLSIPKSDALLWKEGQLSSDAKTLAQTLSDQFEKYGSDKSTIHNYHELYGEILSRMGDKPRILEVGLGSNNTEIASNMGEEGKPGASIRAFRKVFPESELIGADIDPTIKVNDERIFHVDQTDINSFDSLLKDGLLEYDLIIDDGLHAPNANLNMLIFGLQKLSDKGIFVIEDIPIRALDIWHLVPYLIGESYDHLLVQTRSAFVFLVARKGNSCLRSIMAMASQ